MKQLVLATLVIASLVLGTAGAAPALAQAPAPLAAATTLTADEAAGLAFMREEEKLAHDVYVALYKKWGLPVFKNISVAEQTHSDAVKRLLDRYGVEDPASGHTVGVFTDPALQSLYDKLIAQGSLSIADALKVGAAIEEIDILDLQERIAQTDKADIARVYTNLLKGSENHLRAFVSNLKARGETCKPQYLSQAAYDKIIGSSNASGRGNAVNGRRGR